MNKQKYELFTKESQCFILGTQEVVAQRMLEFDWICQREKPSVACFIGNAEGKRILFYGGKEIFVPVYTSLEKATEFHQEPDIVINFKSFRSAYDSSKEALEIPSIRTVAIIAEGMPERQTKILIRMAKELNKVIIGPATVGGIAAGRFRIGNSGGTIENIIKSKLYRPGSVGYTGVSGGLFNEISYMIGQVADGVYEAIPVGGDRFPGSTLLEHLLRYQANPKIKILVMLGELGGRKEYEVVEALKDGRITKPLVAWVTGTCQQVLPPRTQFGHAGAKAGAEEETAQAKNKALKEAGAIVPESFDGFDEAIRKTYQELKVKGVIKEIQEPVVPRLPLDITEAIKKELVRIPSLIQSTISDERGDVLRYAGYSVVDSINKGKGIEDVMSLLWTKELPNKKTTESFKDEVICLVGSLHNVREWGKEADQATIISAKAGVDLVHSVVCGLNATVLPNYDGAPQEEMNFYSYFLFGRTLDLIGHWLDVANKRKTISSKKLKQAPDLPSLISLRWFKKEPKDYEKELIKRIIMLLADNGPCVSGATTTIIAARAGIDLPQSVAAGISTIGPRFGGAITDAAKTFGEGLKKKMTPREFVAWRKSVGDPIIPGIGHRVFNKDKPDSRFVCLKKYIRSLNIDTPNLDFALGVQEVTLEKRPNLILNIDGAIGVILTDLGYPIEALNAFFVLARSIGFTGHWLDQKRLKSRLLRTPYSIAGYFPEALREVPSKNKK